MPPNNDDLCTMTRDDNHIIKTLLFEWTSDTGDGTVDFDFYMSGLLQQVTFRPSLAGTQPANAYDVTILSASCLDVDVLGGIGADCSNAATEHEFPRLLEELTQTDLSNFTVWSHPIAVNGVHTLTIRNAGNGKTGAIALVLSEADPVVHRIMT